MTTPAHEPLTPPMPDAYLVYVFTDPLEIQPPQRYIYSDDAAVQPVCDRLRLMARCLGYPVFHDPTLAPNVVHVTRFDPSNMAPIERVSNMANPPSRDDVCRLERSNHLRPAIYVADAEFIRALVARGNPPVFP